MKILKESTMSHRQHSVTNKQTFQTQLIVAQTADVRIFQNKIFLYSKGEGRRKDVILSLK